MKTFRVLDFCDLTNAVNTVVLRPYIGSKSDPNYKDFRCLCSGVDVKTSASTINNVYSMCFGVIIEMGQDTNNNGKYCVSVQYDNDTVVRYCHLDEIFEEVELNTTIRNGDLIGWTGTYVHFEYCKTMKEDSIWAVKFNGIDYDFYKKDPMFLLDGTEHFPYAIEMEDDFMFIEAASGYVIWDENDEPIEISDEIYEELQPGEKDSSPSMKD